MSILVTGTRSNPIYAKVSGSTGTIDTGKRWAYDSNWDSAGDSFVFHTSFSIPQDPYADSGAVSFSGSTAKVGSNSVSISISSYHQPAKKVLEVWCTLTAPSNVSGFLAGATTTVNISYTITYESGTDIIGEYYPRVFTGSLSDAENTRCFSIATPIVSATARNLTGIKKVSTSNQTAGSNIFLIGEECTSIGTSFTSGILDRYKFIAIVARSNHSTSSPSYGYGYTIVPTFMIPKTNYYDTQINIHGRATATTTVITLRISQGGISPITKVGSGGGIIGVWGINI